MPTTIQKKNLVDSYHRRINYLRISITDRCNLRCRYCAPSAPRRIDRQNLLTLEEIHRLVTIGTRMGINKVRLTGGEPLVRKGVTSLIRNLAQLPSIKDVSLTTNGTLLSRFAQPLRDAGLKRLNISLDTLDREKFRRMTGFDSITKVWDGIMDAAALGFDPIKINTVVMKGYNDDEIETMALLTIKYPFHVRFIEYMPIGTQPHLSHHHFVSIDRIRRRLEKIGALARVQPGCADGPAQRFRFDNAKGEIGLIGSMSSHFCGTCNRLRLTSTGHLRACLLSDEQTNVIDPMRQGATDDELESLFLDVVSRKKREHQLSFQCQQSLHSHMVSIGG